MALNVNQETFPELEVGETIQVECYDDAIETSRQYVALEPHPGKEGILRAIWKVSARKPSSATGIQVRVGPIAAEATVEILETEADKYRHFTELTFQRKRYQVRIGARFGPPTVMVAGDAVRWDFVEESERRAFDGEYRDAAGWSQ